jgi:hypothetical protein
MAKRIVTIDLYQTADRDYYRGNEVDLDGDELKRAEENGWVADARSNEAKSAVSSAHEVPANRAAATTSEGEAANTKASRQDAPGLRGDHLRAEGEAPPVATEEIRTNKS